MNWDSTHKRLTVKEKTTTTIEFTTNKNLDIASIIPSCSCMTVHYSEKYRKLIVKYYANPVPPHLRLQGYYEPTKTIDIFFSNGMRETLSLTVKITK